MITLRQVERITTNSELNPRELRQVPGLGNLAKALIELDQYRVLLRAHAEMLAANERKRHEAHLQWLLDNQRLLTDSMASELKSVGIEPVNRTTANLQRAYDKLIKAVAAEKQEEELLGPDRVTVITNQYRDQPGVVVVQKPPSVRVRTARTIRDQLVEAGAGDREIERLQERIDAIDIYALDEKEAALLREFRNAGYVPVPGDPETRPVLDAAASQRLAEAGIRLTSRVGGPDHP